MKINGKEIKLETQTILSGILKDQGFNLIENCGNEKWRYCSKGRI